MPPKLFKISIKSVGEKERENFEEREILIIQDLQNLLKLFLKSHFLKLIKTS